MKVHLWAFGSPSDKWIAEGENLYVKRIERYLPFEYKTIQASKTNQPEQVLAAEAKWLQGQTQATASKIILLDEKGPQLTSEQFARKFESWRQGSYKRLVFIVGSSYGFSDIVRQLADETLGVSKMTLPHQLCRLLFLEQIYRACTILKGESYHH